MEYAASPVARGSWRQRLLGLPLFYKVLIANSIIVLLGAVAGTTLTLKTTGQTSSLFELVTVFALTGTFLSIVVNSLVLRAALRPLQELEQAVDEVRRGNFNIRAQKVGLSDPNIDALSDTFNGMLDAVERYRAQIYDMSSKVLSAQEEERKRISRELHDDTAQALTAQLLRLKTIEATGGTLDPAGLANLIEMTAQTLEDVRHMAYELRPPSLDDLGLLASLEGLAAQYRERFNLPVTFQAERLKRRLTPDTELALYRIVQEALTNVAKHASESTARVTLWVEDDDLNVRIADNGPGFDPELVAQKRDGGLGLFGMRERASLVGGTLDIRSVAGRGTTILVSIPLSDPM